MQVNGGQVNARVLNALVVPWSTLRCVPSSEGALISNKRSIPMWNEAPFM